MKLPFGLPQVSAAKAAAVVGGIAIFVGLMWAYGNAKYNQGLAEASTSVLLKNIDATKKLQDAANLLTDSSNKFATTNKERDDRLEVLSSTILTTVRNKPLTVINKTTGKCEPTTDFKQTWNDLSNSVRQ